MLCCTNGTKNTAWFKHQIIDPRSHPNIHGCLWKLLSMYPTHSTAISLRRITTFASIDGEDQHGEPMWEARLNNHNFSHLRVAIFMGRSLASFCAKTVFKASSCSVTSEQQLFPKEALNYQPEHALQLVIFWDFKDFNSTHIRVRPHIIDFYLKQHNMLVDRYPSLSSGAGIGGNPTEPPAQGTAAAYPPWL